MPSHPDRVRRNYLTVATDVVDHPRQNEYHLRFVITKASLASWPSPKEAAQALAQRVYDIVRSDFAGPEVRRLL